MCQKGARAEGRVAVPTGRLCKAGFEVKYLPVLGPSGQGRVGGPESPTAGPPSVPPGRPHPRERRQARGGAAWRRLGRPARPQNQYPRVLWGGAVEYQDWARLQGRGPHTAGGHGRNRHVGWQEQ